MSLPMLGLRRHVLSRVPRIYSRSLASVADTVAPAPYQIFDRYTKVLQKDRSATPNRVENSRTVDYVRDEVADRLIERMLVSYCPQVLLCIPERVMHRISSASSTPYSIWGLAQVTSLNCWRLRRHKRLLCLTQAVRCYHLWLLYRILKDAQRASCTVIPTGSSKVFRFSFTTRP